jgi:hypothetical protein
MPSQRNADRKREYYDRCSTASEQHNAPPPDTKAVRKVTIAQITAQLNPLTRGLQPSQVILNGQQAVQETVMPGAKIKSGVTASQTTSTRQQTVSNPQASQGEPNLQPVMHNRLVPQINPCKQQHARSSAIYESRNETPGQKQNSQNSPASQHRATAQKPVARDQQASKYNAIKQSAIRVQQSSKNGSIRQRAGQSPPASSGSQSQQQKNAQSDGHSRKPASDRDTRQSGSDSVGAQNQSLDSRKQIELTRGRESTIHVKFLTNLVFWFRIGNQTYPLDALVPNIASLYNERVAARYPRMEALGETSESTLQRSEKWLICNRVCHVTTSELGEFFFK